MTAATVRYLAIMTGTFVSAAVLVGPRGDMPPVLRIVALDYAYRLPARSAAGMIAVRLVNQGTEPHYARILMLSKDKDLQDVISWRQSGSPMPAWLTRVAGPATTMPGDSTELLERLGAGRYVILCTYPAPNGTSHADLGMIASFQLEGDEATGEDPSSSATILLADYTIRAASKLSAGRPVLQVANRGHAVHQLLLVRLPPGVDPSDEMAWFREGSHGLRPGRPAGGVIELPPGATTWLEVDLEPARYVLICTVIHPDGTRHFDHGMSTILSVN